MGLELGKYQTLPIDGLILDTKNPRIAKWIEIYGGEITAEQMGLALGAASSDAEERGTTFVSLRESIKTNRGIIHPVIVNKKSDGKYVVIEGNTRTLIYQEFRDNNVPGSWDKIPAIVYENLSEPEIDAIRLQAHLVGPRAWDPYSKAKYLVFLANCQYLTTDQIVDFCGGNKREVLEYIAAYHDMENYYRPILDSDDQFDTTRFSAFVELQRPRVLEALLKHRFTKTDFSQWIKKGRLHPLRTVRDLPRILENNKSREVFLKDGAQEAIKCLYIPDTTTALADASISHLAQELIKKINALRWEDFKRLKEPAQEDEKEIIFGASSILSDFCKDLKSED